MAAASSSHHTTMNKAEYTMEQLLRWDAEKGEPYMILPNFPDLRLTPHRREDGDEILFNDPLVGSWAFRRPFPYTKEHLPFVWDTKIPGQSAAAADLQPLFTASGELSPDARPPTRIHAFPVGVIRTPSGHHAGDIGAWYVGRAPPPQSGRAAANGEDGRADQVGMKPLAARLDGGAPLDLPVHEQVYELGYNISADWRRKGLGVEVVKVLQAWATWVGIAKLTAHAELSNVGSQAVLRKANFRLAGTIEQEWPAEKGGGNRTLTEWEWPCAPPPASHPA